MTQRTLCTHNGEKETQASILNRQAPPVAPSCQPHDSAGAISCIPVHGMDLWITQIDICEQEVKVPVLVDEIMTGTPSTSWLLVGLIREVTVTKLGINHYYMIGSDQK